MHKAIRNYCRSCIVAFLAILLLACPLTLGARQEPYRAEPGFSKTARQQLQTLITYSCTEKPIEIVLMDLAEQANVDIVKSPKVTGNVTVKVTDITLEEALTNILAAHDYTYIATESMIRVVPLTEIAVARDELLTRIYQITYADANEVATALSGFVSSQGRVALNKGTGHIIVTDTTNRIKGIDKFIEQIDHLTAQVLVEVRVYDITSKEGFELSPDWHVARNDPLTPNIIFPEEVRTIVTEPYTTNELQERTDTRTPWNPGTYNDWREEERNEETWTTYPATEETETRVTKLPLINRRKKPFVGGSFDRIRGGTLSFSLLNDAVDVDFMLSILHQQVEAKLLANPRILVLDNQTANFEIIRELPYRELLQVAREDPITYTEFKNVGVQLKVTPHIARDGMIRLHIVPEFGVLVGQNVAGVPTVDTRRADTTALIKDGQTIAIGGLRKRQTSKDISKVPVLADMPLIGGLFRSESESVEVNELVVFITVRIVTEPVLSETEQKQLEATGFAGPTITKPEDKRELTEILDLLLEKLKVP